MTLRIYEFISGKQIFPNKNTVLKQIFLSFYWFIQDIYTILLSTHAKKHRLFCFFNDGFHSLYFFSPNECQQLVYLGSADGNE